MFFFLEDREPKVKEAMYEAAAIVEDWQSQCIRGFRSAVDLWELAILPTFPDMEIVAGTAGTPVEPFS